MVVRSASSAAIEVGFEAVHFGGASVQHLFGKEVKGNGLTWDVNQQAIGQLYTPEITDYMYGRNIGGVTMEYVLANPWFFTSCFNDPTQTNTSPTYTYVWTTDPSVNANIRLPKSMHLIISEKRTSTDEVRNAKGAITTSLSLKSAIDQAVSVSQTIQWGHEDAIVTSFPGSIAGDEAFTPMNFTNATIQLPNGTTLATVQDWEVNIDTALELVWGMGTPGWSGSPNLGDAADIVAKQIQITGKINKAKVENSTLLNDVVTRTPIASIRIFITNGLSAGNLKSIEILLTNVGLSLHTTNGLVPADMILEEVTFQAARCQVTAVNNQNVTIPMA